ncbi:MAG: hypothetical protein RIS70_466 [Planctomycetota bacterium]
MEPDPGFLSHGGVSIRGAPGRGQIQAASTVLILARPNRLRRLRGLHDRQTKDGFSKVMQSLRNVLPGCS